MKLRPSKPIYPVKDVDELRRASLSSGGVESWYALYLMSWDQFMERTEKDASEKIVGRPIGLALSPDHKVVGFWPSPDKPYEARVQYATIHEL